MNRNCLFSKVVALLLCAFMLIGYLPSIALPAAADVTLDENESEIDKIETTTEAPAVGSEGNPEPITGEATATLEADSTGYYFVYTNEKSGLLTIYVNAVQSWMYGYEYSVSKDGEVIVSGNSDNDPGFNEYKYIAGTELTIWVNTYYSEPTWDEATSDWLRDESGNLVLNVTHPAGSVGVSFELREGLGTQESPIVLESEYNGYNIPYGETVYFVKKGFEGSYMKVFNGDEYTVTDENGSYVEADGEVIVENTPDPYYFSITNNQVLPEPETTEDGETVEIDTSAYDVYCSIYFQYHEGTVNNPTPVSSTDSFTLTSEEGEKDGYWWYEFKADTNGYLSLNVTSEGAYTYEVKVGDAESETYAVEAGTGAVNVHNEVAYTSGTSYYLIVHGNTADVKIDYEFVVGWGTQDSPFLITELETVQNVPAGAQYFYQCYFGGMIMNITGSGNYVVDLRSMVYNSETYMNEEVWDNFTPTDGVVSQAVTGDTYTPVLFAITNNGTEAADYSVIFTYPEGNMYNPANAVLGDNAVTTVEGDSQGYHLQYVAAEDGNLIVTVTLGEASTGANYTYCVDNKTTGVAGTIMSTYYDDFSEKYTVAVTKGDVINIMVAEASWSALSISANVNLAYEEEEVVLPEGNATLKFASANLLLKSDLTVNFYVKPEVFADDAYTNGRVEFSRVDGLTGETVVTVVPMPETTASNGRYEFSLKGIAPRMMNDYLSVTVYGTYNGVEYSFTKDDWNPKTYCYSQLAGSVAANSETYRALLVDLLNYGSSHQTYASHAVDNLSNADLTDTQKGYATSGTLDLVKVTDPAFETIENPSVTHRGVTLVLSEAVVIRYKIECSDISNIYARITWADSSMDIQSTDFESIGNNQYYIYFRGLSARQLREIVDMKLYSGDTIISNTLRYSVESYVYGQISSTNANLVDLITKMMYYGDAAKAYFGA